MSSTTTESFQRAFEEIQQSYLAPHEDRGVIGIIEFVQVLFRVALERGRISGQCVEDNRIQFQIGDIAPMGYEFNHGAFRTILAAIAAFTQTQTPFLPREERFNFYGDAQEIPYEVDGVVERFHVETFNDTRKTPYRFCVRHLRA